MIRKNIVAVILILSGNQIFSQDTIKGRTIDYETNHTISGVTIVDGNNNRNVTISDRDGNFKIVAEGNNKNLALYVATCYPIKFINIPKGDNNIDFKEIKLVPNHLWDNVVVGGPWNAPSEKQQERDKQLRMKVLKEYRIKIPGKKLKPHFEGAHFETQYLVFDFNTNENE